MKVPKGLQPLVEDGLVDAVIRQLQSGKEASVYMVTCGDQIRCAKVYKDTQHRSFQKATDYTEGRKASRQPQCAGCRQAQPSWPQGAGNGMEERGGGCSVPPGRSRRARAETARRL